MFRRTPSLLLCSCFFLILCGFDGCEGDVPIGEDDAGTTDAGPLDGGSAQCSTPNPAGCTSDAECTGDLVCQIGTLPSECFCDPVNDTWGCTRDLGGGECVDASCSGENPEGECTGDDQCESGEVCRTGTHSSGCLCQQGDWVCTPDLSAGTCETRTCSDPSPQGCETNADCDGTKVCVVGGLATRPSSCTCDTDADLWGCTRDLATFDCVEPNGGDCGDVSCNYTTHYCEVTHPGQPGPSSFACLELPSSCGATPTCASCGLGAVGGGAAADCNDDNGVRVTIALP